MDARQPEDRRTRRQAVERLLDWGFSPAVIAVQLGCSAAWIYRVRRARRRRGTGEQRLTALHNPDE